MLRSQVLYLMYGVYVNCYSNRLAVDSTREQSMKWISMWRHCRRPVTLWDTHTHTRTQHLDRQLVLYCALLHTHSTHRQTVHARLSLFIASYYLTPHGLLYLSFGVVIIIIVVVHCDFFFLLLQSHQCFLLLIWSSKSVRGECWCNTSSSSSTVHWTPWQE